MPRVYLHHATATVRHLRSHWSRQSMTEIAAALGIPAKKLYKLAERQGFTKRTLLQQQAAALEQNNSP